MKINVLVLLMIIPNNNYEAGQHIFDLSIFIVTIELCYDGFNVAICNIIGDGRVPIDRGLSPPHRSAHAPSQNVGNQERHWH